MVRMPVAESAPITVAIARTVSPGQYAYVESWVRQGITLAARMPGFLGAGWVVDRPNGTGWHMLYRFDTAANLVAWESSPERQRWLQAGREFSADEGIDRRTGIEGWFSSAEGEAMPGERVEIRTAEPRPPVWKQAIAVWVAFLPMNLLFTFLFSLIPGFTDLPLVPRLAITTSVLTPIMVVFVLPFVTRALGPWLLRGRT